MTLQLGDSLEERLAELARRRDVESWFHRFTPDHVETRDGLRLHLDVIETEGARATVVFMPGTNAYGLLYGEFLTALADRGFHVVAFDPRGHGRSDGERGSYTLPELVDDLGGVADHARARFGDPVFAAGSSQGGMAAFYRLAEDDRLAGAICHNLADLADPASARLTRYPRLAGLVRPLVPWLARIAPEFPVPMNAYLDLGVEPVRGVGTARALLEADPLLVPYVRLRTMASLGSAALPKPVEEIDRPVLVLHAGADGIFPLDYIEDLYRRLPGPKRMHVYPGLAHYMIVDHVDAFLDDVVAWLEEFAP